MAHSASPARPLTARSVVASTLLGMTPPRLSTRLLVASGELFGISPGTTRVALSRMVGAGELEADEGGYRLAGHLLDRQERQRVSRSAATRAWDGTWTMAVVSDGRRAATDRAELRHAMRVARMGEARPGVWLRPDNLRDGLPAEAEPVVAVQCARFTVRPDDESPADLAARLWDLGAWARRAEHLGRQLAVLTPGLEAGDTEGLAPGFIVSAAVLRHLVADPLLPTELVAPGWPGPALRADYDRYDRAYKAVWRDWFHTQV